MLRTFDDRYSGITWDGKPGDVVILLGEETTGNLWWKKTNSKWIVKTISTYIDFTGPDNYWQSIAGFDTKEEAEQFAQDILGERIE